MKLCECFGVGVILTILTVVACSLMLGCNKTTEEPKAQPFQFGTVYKFKYKKHSYIGFSYYKGWGVVHNPECGYCKQAK
jgi:hypothetical protein